MILKDFTPKEFGGDFDKMQEPFLIKLQKARSLAGIPFKITSSFRDGDEKSHGRGWAVDISAKTSTQRFKIVAAALEVGFTRIGVYDKHIHLDCDPSLPQDVLWVGTSR